MADNPSVGLIMNDSEVVRQLMQYYITGVRPEIPVIDNAVAGQGLVVDADTTPKSLTYGEGSGGGGTADLTEITYAELKALRDGGTLTPGMQYRITDYVCTVANEENAQVESHPYDIIVIADSASVLNENARACVHEGDTYYNNGETTDAVLANWELKYCIDNDADRFNWADTENGKGVVYYLKDDRNNECWYDFKQIKFKRFEITNYELVPSLVGNYADPYAVTDFITVDEQNPKWFFTFSYVDEENNSIVDSSINRGFLVYDNNFGVTKYFNEDDGYCRLTLSRNTFIGYVCHSNTFGNGCEYNTFNNSDNVCTFNTFSDNCDGNIFGDGFSLNTFDVSCSYNTFGRNCLNNILGKECAYNTFNINCQYNTFGDRCEYNALSSNCKFNTFGDDCGGNTFNYKCEYNTLGNSCYNNTFGETCSYNTFGERCDYLDMTTTGTKLYNILSRTYGTDQSHIVLQATANNSFVTYVGKNSSNVLKYYCPMDSAT